jgi:MoxR-like ATPase
MVDLAMDLHASRVADFVARARAIEGELGKAIVGQHEVVQQVLLALFSGGHVLIEGVPGVGKTLLVRTLSRVVSLRFSRIQFTPDLMPADIVGTNVVSEDQDGRRALHFHAGPVFANLVLADEINRATPKTQSAMLEAMQEQTVSVGDSTRPLPQPFLVLATQNPIEMEGTYPLPEAQLDRFMLKILVTFPGANDLFEILQHTIGANHEHEAEVVATGDDVVAMRRIAHDVTVAPHIAHYAVQLVLATHGERGEAPRLVRQYVRHGASPRGLQALVSGAQVRALLAGRFNVAREDLQALAQPALRHRLVLGFEAQVDGVTADQIVADVLARVPSPKP